MTIDYAHQEELSTTNTTKMTAKTSLQSASIDSFIQCRIDKLNEIIKTKLQSDTTTHNLSSLTHLQNQVNDIEQDKVDGKFVPHGWNPLTQPIPAGQAELNELLDEAHEIIYQHLCQLDQSKDTAIGDKAQGLYVSAMGTVGEQSAAANEKAQELYASGQQTAQQMSETVSKKAEETTAAAYEAGQSVAQQAQSMYDAAAAKTGEAADNVQKTATDSYDAAGQMISQASQDAQAMGAAAVQSTKNAVNYAVESTQHASAAVAEKLQGAVDATYDAGAYAIGSTKQAAGVASEKSRELGADASSVASTGVSTVKENTEVAGESLKKVAYAGVDQLKSMYSTIEHAVTSSYNRLSQFAMPGVQTEPTTSLKRVEDLQFQLFQINLNLRKARNERFFLRLAEHDAHQQDGTAHDLQVQVLHKAKDKLRSQITELKKQMKAIEALRVNGHFSVEESDATVPIAPQTMEDLYSRNMAMVLEVSDYSSDL